MKLKAIPALKIGWGEMKGIIHSLIGPDYFIIHVDVDDNFGHDIQNLPPSEAAVLRKRFELTQINFNGAEARTLR